MESMRLVAPIDTIRFQVYIAHGKLQLALPLEKVKETSQLSLMVSYKNIKEACFN
jgi:hypothetical protein